MAWKYYAVRLVISAVVTLTTIQTSWTQGIEFDSLENVVNTTTGIAKVDALNALAFRLILIDIKRAKEYISQAGQLAEEINYAKGISQALICEGLYENVVGNRKVAIHLLKIGRTKAKQSQAYGWEGYALVQLGNIYRGQGLYDTARYWYDQSYLVLKDSLNPWHLSVLYRNLSQNYGLINRPKEELAYLHRSLAIREKLSDNILLADVLILLSHWHLNQSNLSLANDYLDRAQKLSNPELVSEIQKEIYYQKAIILFHYGEYNRSLELLNDVKQFYLDNGYLQQYVKTLVDVAEVLHEMGNYDISLKNGFEALKICEEKKYLNDAVRAQLIIGHNYYRLKQLKTAQQFADACTTISRENSFEAEEAGAYSLQGVILKSVKQYSDARFNFEKALEIRTKLNDQKFIAASLSSIGQTYELEGKLQLALSFQKQSVAIKESILHQNGLAWGYFDLGSIYTKLKDFNNAQKYLDKAEEKARYIKSGIILMNVYETRRNLLIAQGNSNAALRYTFLYEELKDSVNSVSITNRVLSLQGSYELEKRDQQIELLNKSKQLQEDQITIQENRINRQQFFIIASVLGLILLSVLAYTLYNYFKRMSRLNKEIRAQSEQLSKANTSLSALNSDLAEKQEEIQAQSEELTEANNNLTMLNMELAEKHEEMTAQSEELSEANAQFIHLNNELAGKQNELEAQAEELRESYDVISELNESLEQKVTDRTREMKQAYKELDTFFYRSSHDFRRPLTTFMGLSEVAKITVKDQNALDLFEKVKETAVNLDRMLIKLQSISDVGAHQFVYREVSMQTVFENALDTYQEAIDNSGIRISVNVGVIKAFLSYPAFLKIIIENLLENAIQFRGRTDPHISMVAMEKYGGVEIAIQDNGQGVEEEYQDRVFDMFFRGNEQSKGNGLGLYIVKKAVSKLGGTLHLDTKFSEGTTISIWIPLKQKNIN